MSSTRAVDGIVSGFRHPLANRDRRSRAVECEDFCFAFIVSFVAGAALFGSAFLIPSFAVCVLAFRPTDAGLLLLPSGAFFVGTLLVAAS